MCQEDAENKISKECLRNRVDEAIKTKNISVIEGIEKEDLRYAQKYTELQISKIESKASSKSYLIGLEGVSFAIIAIGGSLVLFGISKIPMVETMYFYLGIVIVIMGMWIWYGGRPYQIKEFDKIEKDIEFMHEIILRIEEKL